MPADMRVGAGPTATMHSCSSSAIASQRRRVARELEQRRREVEAREDAEREALWLAEEAKEVAALKRRGRQRLQWEVDKAAEEQQRLRRETAEAREAARRERQAARREAVRRHQEDAPEGSAQAHIGWLHRLDAELPSSEALHVAMDDADARACRADLGDERLW